MKNPDKNKIIVIDDSTFARADIYTKLKSIGFNLIDLPEDSSEGWNLIANSVLNDEPYDLVITDLNMPGLDGAELIKKIKTDPISKDLKIMVISSDSEQKIIDNVLDLGAEYYLVKPFSVDDLQTSLTKLKVS